MIRMITCFGMLLVCLIATGADDAKRRTWTSADGSYSVDANFVSLTAGTVTLERVDDGRQISVELERLSEDDREFIRERRWLRVKVKPESPFVEVDTRQRWINTSYGTQIYHVEDREWAEVDRNGKARWSKPLVEVERTGEYIELRNADRGHVWRIFGPRMEVQEDGRWRWLASGHWVTENVARAATRSEVPAKRKADLESPWSGFRGIAWGTAISQLPDMVSTADDGRGTVLYKRNGENLSIGDARLKSVNYMFYKSRFMSVRTTAEGSANWQLLRDAVFARYGEGRRLNQFREDWIWADSDVVVRLEYNTISESASLLLFYQPILDERSADDKERAKEAGEDF